MPGLAGRLVVAWLQGSSPMVAEFYSAAGVPSVGSSSQGGNWEELNRKYMLKSHSRHSRKLRLRWNTETHTAGGGGVTAIRGGEVGGMHKYTWTRAQSPGSKDSPTPLSLMEQGSPRYFGP